MLGRRILVLTLVALFASGGATVLVAAQDAGSGDTPSVSHGYIYLTGEEVGRVDTTGDELCYEEGYGPVHGMDVGIPRSADAEKVHAGRSSSNVACLTNFRYEVTDGFSLGPGTTLTVWLFCETPFVTRGGGWDNGVDYKITLLRNDEKIAAEEGYYPFEPAAVCPSDAMATNPGPLRLDIPFDVGSTFLESGDTLDLQAAFFGYVDPTQSMYYLVNGRTYPASLHGPGFPGLLRSHLHGDIAVSAEGTSSSAGPGNTTTYTMRVWNLAATEGAVTVTVDGPPEGWTATPLEPLIHLAPNGTREAHLTVTAPADAVQGQKVDHEVSVAFKGEEITFTATTQVVPGTGTPAEPSPPDVDPGDELALTAAPEGGDAATADAAGEAASLKSMLLGIWQEVIATLVVASLAGLIAVLRG